MKIYAVIVTIIAVVLLGHWLFHRCNKVHWLDDRRELAHLRQKYEGAHIECWHDLWIVYPPPPNRTKAELRAQRMAALKRCLAELEEQEEIENAVAAVKAKHRTSAAE